MTSGTEGLVRRILELSAIAGPPGREGPVRRGLEALLPPAWRADPPDAAGDLAVRLSPRPGAPRLLLLVPMDEPALVVTGLDRRGRAHAAALGRWPAAAWRGGRVRLPSGARAAVAGGRGPFVGRSRPGGASVRLDFGFRNRAEAAGAVAEGDAAVPDLEAVVLPGGAVCGKALASRAACAAALEVCAGAVGPDLAWDATVAFVGQSELGSPGAAALCRAHPADLVLAVGAVSAAPGAPRGGQVALGAGPALLVSDRGLLSASGALAALEGAAARAGVPLQRAVADPGASPAGPARTAGPGVDAAAIGFGLRYPHAPVQVCSPDDVAGAVRVLGALLRAAP